MNDQAYGVIENIQDNHYGSRRHYSKLATPNFSIFCKSINLPHQIVRDVEDFQGSIDKALKAKGPQMVEVDMCSIGPYAEVFSGPPAGAANNKEIA
jgi:acetolactate synthase-1/2/3 large subunit